MADRTEISGVELGDCQNDTRYHTHMGDEIHNGNGVVLYGEHFCSNLLEIFRLFISWRMKVLDG